MERVPDAYEQALMLAFTPRRQSLLALGLFAVLTLLMTYPLVLHLGTHVRDHGDPLLNAWILAWNNRQTTRLDLGGWFEANIFHPQRDVLAYSEHLFPQALAALPVQILSGNPILAYNFVLLLSFLTSAFGMFLLARKLTGHFLGSVAAGFLFAFSPFMLFHLFHLQVITAGGIPLAFLFLLRFFESRRWKDILLFSLFFILQSLANGYYALYLVVMAGLFLLVMAFARSRVREPRFWAQMSVFVLLAAVCLGPFIHRYDRIRSDRGLDRGIGGARLTSYLAAPPYNILYGRITSKYYVPERGLFPGAAAFVLAVAGAAATLGLRKRSAFPSQDAPPRPAARALMWGWTALIASVGYVLYTVLLKGKFEVIIAPGLDIHSRSPLKPFLFLVLLLAAYQALKKILRTGPLLGRRTLEPVAWTLFLILVLAFLMTLGPGGPYELFAKLIPGFEGLRAAPRTHIFVMFSLSLFAAFGLREAARRLKGKARAAVLFLAPLTMLVEYLSIPLPYTGVPVKKDIPAVYQWLASQKEDFALLELPLPHPTVIPGELECPRVYYSAYHWKRLVNGYSGYIPPLYGVLQERWWGGAPLERNLRDLQSLGVRYLVVHEVFMPRESFQALVREMALRPDLAVFVGEFGKTLVYEIRDWDEGGRALRRPPSPLREIDRSGWRVWANVNPEAAALAVDGDGETRWDTAEPQRPGHHFEADLGEVERLDLLRLVFSPSTWDYPRGFTVQATQDGQNWMTVSRSDEVHIDIRQYIQPKDFSVDIPLPGICARAFRVTITGQDPVWYWSIHELFAFSAEPGRPGTPGKESQNKRGDEEVR